MRKTISTLFRPFPYHLVLSMTTSQPSSLDLLIEQISRLTAGINDLSSKVASIKRHPYPPSTIPKKINSTL
ncbi:hypothetical protein VNO78_00628 [Psophocarpus tetragonolobus]|uniref:Uncharacterized protein n=1 Tax=Psophocarpus tetragonolobus TaxID=3891 RepID=A0AAN9SXK8_PSOTE